MRSSHFAPLGALLAPLGALPVAFCLLWPTQSLSQEKTAQEKTPAATRQYNAAVGLQNSEAYDLAAEQWIEFLGSHKSDPRIDRAWHYLGVCRFKQKKYGEAAKAFETVLRSFPNFDLRAEAYFNLGLAQYNMAQAGQAEMYDAAAATFDTLVAKHPDAKSGPQALFFQAQSLYNRGKSEPAAEKFALFLAQSPKSPLAGEATLGRGEALYAMKQYAEAAKAYATAAATEGFPLADYATLRWADALAALKQHAQAADLYASVPTAFPGSQYAPLCHLEAGKQYYAAGNLAKAQQSLGKVVDAGDESAGEAAHWMARSLLKQSKPAEALAVVEKVLPQAGQDAYAARLLMDQADAVYEIPERRAESVALYAALAAKHPGDAAAPQALYMAALAAMNVGDYRAALTHADALLAAHGDHELRVGALQVMAESKLAMRAYADAEKLYDELLKQWPDDRDAEIWKVHRGTAICLQNKHQEAIAALRPVVAEIKAPDLAAEAWYRMGRSQAALGQFDAAVKSLEASLAAEFQWKAADDTHLVLAYACQQTKDFEKAQQHARKVIAEFPQSKLLDLAHYRLAECSRLAGDLKTAVAEYQRIVKDWPQSALTGQVLFGLGWALLGQKDYPGAERAFDTLIEKHPDGKLLPDARYGRAMARQQRKQYAPAIEDLQAVLAADPSPAEKSRARYILGRCQRGLEQYDEAVATLQALLDEDPEYADADDAYFELAWAQKSLGQEAEAATTFATLTQKYPQSPLAADSHFMVGDHALDQKDYQKAAVAYYAAMQKADKTPLGEEAAYKLGLAYYLQEDLEKAHAMFKYQRHTWPKGPLAADATFMAAECLFKQKKYQEALAAYDLVESPSGKDAKLLGLLHAGNAAGQLKQWDKSLELLGKCVAEFPDSPHTAQALYEQGWALQNLGKLDEAMVLYAKVVATSNAEPAARAQFMIGEIQFDQRKHAEAIKSFFKVSYGYDYPQWQADATYEAGRCFEVMGKKAQAVKQYRQLLEKYPDSDKVPLAKERVGQLE